MKAIGLVVLGWALTAAAWAPAAPLGRVGRTLSLTPLAAGSAGLSASDWQAIEAQIRAAEYHITRRLTAPGSGSAAGEEWWAPNRRHDFEVSFRHGGVHLGPRRRGESPWRWSWRLVSWGREGALAPVAPVAAGSVRVGRTAWSTVAVRSSSGTRTTPGDWSRASP